MDTDSDERSRSDRYGEHGTPNFGAEIVKSVDSENERLVSEDELREYIERPDRRARNACGTALALAIVGLLLFGRSTGPLSAVGTASAVGAIFSFAGLWFFSLRLRHGRQLLVSARPTAEDADDAIGIEDDAR